MVIPEVLYKQRLDKDPEIVTSLRYLSQDKKNPFTKAVTKAVKKVGLIGKDEPLDPNRMLTKLIFVSVQLLYTMLLMLPGYFFFKWYEASVSYLMFCFFVGTWNGASYYIEIFSTR